MRFYEIIRENKVADIAKLNNIRDVNKIFVGQKLKLPDGSEYVVARGDTLSGIASGRFRGTAPRIQDRDKQTREPEKKPSDSTTDTGTDMDRLRRRASDVAKQEPPSDSTTDTGTDMDRLRRRASDITKQEPKTEVPLNVVRSADGTPVRTGTGGFVTSGTPPDPEKVKAAKEKLTPSQLRWLGKADPTDPAVMARMPKPLPGEVKPERLKPVTIIPKNVRLASSDIDVANSDDDLMTRFYTAAAEYGKPVTISSAKRDDRKQAELWVRDNILNDPKIHMAAKPKNDQTITYQGKTYKVKGGGKGSTHLDGDALDIRPGAGSDFEPILKKYGLHFPYPDKDPVHIEIKKG